VHPTAAAVPARAGVVWLIWTVGVAAYILTVMQRTTLAAAGLDAADRFGLSPGTLAAFVFIQVAVFSVAQIPAGLMVDRFGPRAMLVANAVLLACGQILLVVPWPSVARPLATLAQIVLTQLFVIRVTRSLPVKSVGRQPDRRTNSNHEIRWVRSILVSRCRGSLMSCVPGLRQ
jgi:MFS family permease